jgi:DNA-binding GntR family transcriptional regulator
MENLKAKTYENLRFRIMTHDLPPSKMLNEKELMNHYGIGRAPLREIFIELQRDGLIQRFPRSGTIVAPMDFHLFKQVIEIRTNLEGLAAQLATERITESELEVLRQVLLKVDQYKAEDKDDILSMLTEFEFQFHNIIYEASHNMKLKDILHELHGITARFWYYWVFNRQEVLDQFKDHKKLMDALEKRDAKVAREVMIAHIQNFTSKIVNKIL